MDIDDSRNNGSQMINMMPLEFAERQSKTREFWDFLCCCCGRVGNLIVVCEAPRKPGQKRQLLCVVGPYWSMMLFCTTPLIIIPCVFGLLFMAPRVPLPLTIVFGLSALFVLGSLWKTATTDPGLIVRRSENPEERNEIGSDQYDDEEDIESRGERRKKTSTNSKKRKPKKWSWDDRTQTWRPVTAKYADDCGVLVDEYDHTCPWTGTAIGKGNIRYFYIFTASIFPLLIFLVICVFIAMANDKND